MPAFSQNPTYDSYLRAQTAIDRAVAAYGGAAALRDLKTVRIEAAGETVHRNQSRKPFTSDRTPYKIDLAIDAEKTSLVQTVEGGYPGGFKYANGIAIVGTEGRSWDAVRKTRRIVPNPPVSILRQRYRYFPHLLIRDAMRRTPGARYLGAVRAEGTECEVVTYANEDGANVSLFIDSKNGRLVKVETLTSDAFAGDVVVENVFTGTAGAPAGRLTRVGGELTEALRYAKYEINQTIADSAYAMPADYGEFRAAPQSDPVQKHAEGIYTVVAGGYNVLFVEFSDHIFVMEAPGGDNVSRQAIAAIKRTIPNKPIKYIAVTHHHDDHAGGIRTYIAEGATVIALPNEKPFFEKVVTSRFVLNPDSLSRNPQPLKIEVISDGRRVLSDGTRTIELHDIGSGPHTEQMLVAYVPALKAVFQGDLLNRPTNGDPPIANDTSAHFWNWIESSGLAVEKIIPVHGTVTTMDEFRKAVAEMKQ
ncbi:MAG: MBL fold metallo-hydrolase [Pyrinomonadaceae bacterium]